MSNNPDDQFQKIYLIFYKNQLASLNDFLQIMQSTLDDRVNNIDIDLDSIKNEEGFKENLDAFSHEILNKEGEVLEIREHENLLRKTFIVSLYSFMELWLLRDCRHKLKLRKDLKLSLSDLSGKGLEKAKTCYSKVLGIDYSFGDSKDWYFITQLKAMRNCIVHRQGSLTGLSDLPITGEAKKLKTFVQIEKHLRFYGPGEQIFIESDFCLKSLVIIDRFMMSLLFI